MKYTYLTEHADHREQGAVRADLFVNHQVERLIISGLEQLGTVRHATQERSGIDVVRLGLVTDTADTRTTKREPRVIDKHVIMEWDADTPRPCDKKTNES